MSPLPYRPALPLLSLLSLAMLLGLAQRAPAGECAALQSGTWGPVTGGSALWDCGGGPPAADDHFVVPAGITVSITANVLQAPDAAAGITVEAGGSLQAVVDTDPLTIEVGGQGLVCESGSVCILRGGYRVLGAGAPATLPDPDASARAAMPSILPCPGRDATGPAEPDCNGSLATPGDPAVLRLAWPAGAVPAGLTAGLAAVLPGEDVLCVDDAVPDDAVAPADVNHCYEIVAASTGAQTSLDVDVRQGHRDQPGYPLSRRALVQTTLTAPLAAGDRDVGLDGAAPSAAALDADGRLVARWLRFAAPGSGGGCPAPGPAACAALGRAYKILETVDGGGGAPDLARIGDLRGVEEAHAAGETAWIDYGWAPGDSFVVLAPVTLRSSTPVHQDSEVELEGTVYVQAVVLDDLRWVRLDDAVVLGWRDVWIRDASPKNSETFRLSHLTGATLGRTQITGGDDTPPGDQFDRAHAVGLVDLVDTTLHDFAIRHPGDDCLVNQQGDPSTGLVAERVHCSFRSDFALTTNLWSVGGSATDYLLREGICDDCVDAGGDKVVVTGAVPATVDGLLGWGVQGVTATGSSSTMFRDVMMVGARADIGGTFVPSLVDGFVVRESRNASLQGSALVAGTGTIDARNGIVRDVVVGQSKFLLAPAAGVLHNIAILDAATTDPACTQCEAIDWAMGGGSILSRLTLAWRPGVAAPFHHALRNRALASGETLDGLLVTGFRGPRTQAAWHVVAPASNVPALTIPAGPCFHDNGADATPGLVPWLPPTTLQGVAPGYVDLADGRIDVVSGSPAAVAGCGVLGGVEAPGIQRFRWYHAVSKLVPERLADDADGDGIPEDAAATVCAGGLATGCSDNCTLFNPDQGDADGDAVGDACEPACGDGLDNDGDGLVDTADPGCRDAAALDEAPECDDGLDNDGDGGIDWDGGPGGGTADAQCPAGWLGPEKVRHCGLGFEAGAAVALLFALRGTGRRRRLRRA